MNASDFFRRTYITTTLALTSVVFVVGCLGWWTPTLLHYAWAVNHGTSHTSSGIKAEFVVLHNRNGDESKNDCNIFCGCLFFYFVW